MRESKKNIYSKFSGKKSHEILMKTFFSSLLFCFEGWKNYTEREKGFLDVSANSQVDVHARVKN